jgi:hypothetical protein
VRCDGGRWQHAQSDTTNQRAEAMRESGCVGRKGRRTKQVFAVSELD